MRYDVIKCEVCGMPWEEHPESCSNHLAKDRRIAERHSMTGHPRWRDFQDRLLMNGWEYAPDRQTSSSSPPGSTGLAAAIAGTTATATANT